MRIEELLERLDVKPVIFKKTGCKVFSPIDGKTLGNIEEHSSEEVHAAIKQAKEAFLSWRKVPAPKRGELIRIFSEELRKSKSLLGQLISIETGKILAEGEGEVQEMIDICDFALGLSRQLYGLTIASERFEHRMMEVWHPLGVIGVITAFNFPAAVWSWNTALAIVCGNSVVWKPSEKAPLTALACQALFKRAMLRFGKAPEGLSQVVLGDRKQGQILVDHPNVALVSATGSTKLGEEVGPRVAKRFGRSLLELGGNNAIIVGQSADLALATRGIVFGAIGTAGQRCTTTRRVIAHESIYEKLLTNLRAAYEEAIIGNPLKEGTLVGPLIDQNAFDNMQRSLVLAQEQGGRIVFGGRRELIEQYPAAYYVRPALVEMPEQTEIVKTETFAPILYVMKYTEFEKAIELQNDVPQGLSAALFSNDLREAEIFMSAAGADCGIVNINIGTSGAEIGGAFGGEKETGGGRESGSDAWKVYMRRVTNTINYSTQLPLAQGIKFGN